MGSFSVDNNTANGFYNLSGDNGSQDGNTAHLSVGAPFSITARWSFGGCSADITAISVTIDSNDFVVKYNNCGDSLTTYGLRKGYAYNQYTHTWAPCSGTMSAAFLELCAGKTAASQVFTVRTFYSFAGQTFDESVTFNVVVEVPTYSFTFLPPDPNGPDKFQFGPFEWSETAGGTTTYYHSPVGWNDSGYNNYDATKQYNFGACAGGVSAFRSYGSITNGTHSDGNSYLVQLARILFPPEVTPANFGGVRREIVLNGTMEYVRYLVNQPRDGSGNTLWGTDNSGNDTSDFPWAYEQVGFTRAVAGSGSLAVPVANSIPDLNNVNQSYWADSPSGTFPDVAGTTQTVTDIACVELNFNPRFKTYLVWQADGGIPIGLALATWSVDSNEYNGTADKALDPGPVVGQHTAGNWDLTKTYQTFSGPPVDGPYYLYWDYTIPDYNSAAPSRIFTRSRKGSFFNSLFGSNPMGGSGPSVAMNGTGLPRSTGANFVGMNMT